MTLMPAVSHGAVSWAGGALRMCRARLPFQGWLPLYRLRLPEKWFFTQGPGSSSSRKPCLTY